MAKVVAMSLDELDELVAHRLDRLVPGIVGYRPVCVCGWTGFEYRTKVQARAANLEHVARTPYGKRMRAQMSRYGA